MLDFTCCDSLITNVPGTGKSPASRARAPERGRYSGHIFLAHSAPPARRAFYVIGVLFYYKKRTAYPPQKAVLRHDLKPSHY